MKKDLSWLKNEFIAHRGQHSEDKSIPENSKSAFIKAIENGFGIECDLNITKDNQVVVVHDHNLSRLCNANINLYDIDLVDAQKYKILDTDNYILTLKQLLELVDGKVPLLIEIKTKLYKRILINALELLKDYKGTFAIFSFDPRVSIYLKKHNKDIVRGCIAGVYPETFLMKSINKLSFNFLARPDFVSYDITHMPNKYLDKAQKHKIVVIGFVARKKESLDFVKSIYSNTVFEFFDPKEEL